MNRRRFLAALPAPVIVAALPGRPAVTAPLAAASEDANFWTYWRFVCTATPAELRQHAAEIDGCGTPGLRAFAESARRLAAASEAVAEARD